RRRLSEPRIAGKAPAVWFSSQRLTSVGDSFLLMYTCGLFHTYCQAENSCQKNATNPGFYVLTSVLGQKLAKLGVGGRTWPRVCARDRRRTGRRAVPAAVCIGIGSTEALKNHRSVVGRRDLQFARY